MARRLLTTLGFLLIIQAGSATQCYECVFTEDSALEAEFEDDLFDANCKTSSAGITEATCAGTDNNCVTVDAVVTLTDGTDTGMAKQTDVGVFARGCLPQDHDDDIESCDNDVAAQCSADDAVQAYLNSLLKAESGSSMEVSSSIACTCPKSDTLCNSDLTMAVTDCAAEEDTEKCHVCMWTDDEDLAGEIEDLFSEACKDGEMTDEPTECNPNKKCAKVQIMADVTIDESLSQRTLSEIIGRGCIDDTTPIPECADDSANHCESDTDAKEFIEGMINSDSVTIAEPESSMACTCTDTDGGCNDGDFEKPDIHCDVLQECHVCMWTDNAELKEKFGDLFSDACEEGDMTGEDLTECAESEKCAKVQIAASVTIDDGSDTRAMSDIIGRGCIASDTDILECGEDTANHCGFDEESKAFIEGMIDDEDVIVGDPESSAACTCADSEGGCNDGGFDSPDIHCSLDCYDCFYLNDDDLLDELNDMNDKCIEDLDDDMLKLCQPGEVCVQALLHHVHLTVGEDSSEIMPDGVIRGCLEVDAADEEECPASGSVDDLKKVTDLAVELLEKALVGTDVDLDTDSEMNDAVGCTCDEQDGCNGMDLVQSPAPEDDGAASIGQTALLTGALALLARIMA